MLNHGNWRNRYRTSLTLNKHVSLKLFILETVAAMPKILVLPSMIVVVVTTLVVVSVHPVVMLRRRNWHLHSDFW